MDFASVEEIEYLHHDKSVENEGEMTRIYFCFIVNIRIVMISIDLEHPTRNCMAICCVFVALQESWSLIKFIFVLHQNILTQKYEDH